MNIIRKEWKNLKQKNKALKTTCITSSFIFHIFNPYKTSVMKQLTSLLFILLFTFTILNCQGQDKTVTGTAPEVSTFYFIRHAEKDRSDKTNRNPELTDTGHARAIKWKEVFSNISFDVVYSTDYNRTKQTAQPTATKNNLKLTIYNPRTIDGKAFLKNNKGKTALIVGHSNTTPAFVNAVIGEKQYGDINDSNNANLYIVTIIDNQAQSTVLQIN